MIIRTGNGSSSIHHSSITKQMKSTVSARLNADLLDENYEKWRDDPLSMPRQNKSKKSPLALTLIHQLTT